MTDIVTQLLEAAGQLNAAGTFEAVEIAVLEAAEEIERLRALVLKYEAAAATVFGTLEPRPSPDDEPFTVMSAPQNTPI